MQILVVYRIACMTSATLAGVFCNSNFCYSRLETCDADRCKRASVSLGKVSNTDVSIKFGGGGIFHCNTTAVCDEVSLINQMENETIKCKYVVWVWKVATCHAVFGFQKNLYCMTSKRGSICATRTGYFSCRRRMHQEAL